MTVFDERDQFAAETPALRERSILANLRTLGPLRMAGLVATVAMVVSAVGLYQFKHEAQDRRSNIARLRTEIAAQRTAVDLLQAELTFLNRPERIQALAERFLNLQPATMEQVVAVGDIAIREDPAPSSIEDLLKAQK
jgi:cell division protein FtsL